jgi:hypothetical protein
VPHLFRDPTQLLAGVNNQPVSGPVLTRLAGVHNSRSEGCSSLISALSVSTLTHFRAIPGMTGWMTSENGSTGQLGGKNTVSLCRNTFRVFCTPARPPKQHRNLLPHNGL